MQWVLSLILVMFFYPVNAENIERMQIEERIKPVGQVRVEQHAQETPVKVTAPQKTQEVPKGKAIYDQFCHVCHQAGLAGAPKYQVKEDWSPRLKGRTLDDLTTTAIQGINAMPPKGTCVDCNEADIKAAIEYMVPK